MELTGSGRKCFGKQFVSTISQLDNPVWSALTSGNSDLAVGNEKAKRFKPGISPFVAVAQCDFEHYQALKELIQDKKETVIIVTTDKNPDVSPWTIVNRIDGYQMVYEGEAPGEQDEIEIRQLSEENVQAMLELTKLSPPGPFMEGTIRFGGYQGVFDGKQLVAMTGHRLHSGPYVEISAVCTHPDHTGRGYARALISNQISRLRAAGKLPYLHVKSDNTRACSLYESMGFVKRTEMMFYLLN